LDTHPCHACTVYVHTYAHARKHTGTHVSIYADMYIHIYMTQIYSLALPVASSNSTMA
jgi:hypothetical protein